MPYEEYSRAGYNSIQQKNSNAFRDRTEPGLNTVRPPRRGKIVRAYQGYLIGNIPVIMVEIAFDDKVNKIGQASYVKQFILEHPVTDLALLYGDIDDLVIDADGNHRTVEVRFFGDKPDQGIARIINSSGRGDLESANTLEDFGTILAPAGGGVI